MPPQHLKSIRQHLRSTPAGANRFLADATTSGVVIAELSHGTCLGGRLAELAGRSVLLITKDQLAAALALIELDGVANRIVICPPDISAEQLPWVMTKGAVDAVVSDHKLEDLPGPAGMLRVFCGSAVGPVNSPAADSSTTDDSSITDDSLGTNDFFYTDGRPTEWVLLTSGTSGLPKMIVHSLASLAAPINLNQVDMSPVQVNSLTVVWGTFYDIRRYGGLQIFLRAILGSGSLVLSRAGEPVADHLVRLGAHGVTHLSGTPSHWRRALMSPQIHAIAPQYLRLSGEIADQAILHSLRSSFPNSAVGHAFASTEAGVAFEVNDGLAGFPSSLLGQRGAVEMKIVNDSLQIRSDRIASCYLDDENGTLMNDDGFVDTGDMVELRDDRYYFLGRRNGVINVAGLKVYPEEVEAVINRHPAVRMSMVRSRNNPFTGALVSADVVLKDVLVLKDVFNDAELNNEILDICRQNLPAHKIPASIRYVPVLEVAAAGKLARRNQG